MMYFALGKARPTGTGSKRYLQMFALSCMFTAVTPVSVLASDAYPNKPVKIIVNYAPGGPNDLFARIIAEKLQSQLKQPFIVENRTGAGGNIGAAAVAKADPDGYTVLVTVDAPITISPSLYSKMPFTTDELKPVMLAGSLGHALAVNPSIGVKSLKDFVAKAKAEDVTFSSAGSGSTGHLASAIFATTTGAKVTHVSYRGNAPAVTALVGGEVQAAMVATPGIIPYHKANRLNVLAVTGKQRSPLLPDVPTVKELGYPDLMLEFYYTVMVPAKTPDAVVNVLQKSITAALALPDVKERLKPLDFTPMNMTGPQVNQVLSESRERYAKIIKETGMKPE